MEEQFFNFPKISVQEDLCNLYCQIHKKRFLEWICVDKDCPQRLFCSFCVINDHKKIHVNFVPVKNFLSDPFSTLNLLSNKNIDDQEVTNTKESIKDQINELLKENLEKIDLICNSIINTIYKKFQMIKQKYNDEIDKFLNIHEKDYVLLEKTRKEFSEFSNNYFENVTCYKFEELKQGINLLISKYYSNNEILTFFQTRVNSLPIITIKENYKINIENHLISNLKWNYFADKCLSTWSINTKNLPNEFIFSNFDLTAKAKEVSHGMTLVGNEIMEFGYHKWSVLIEEIQGEYLNLGVIQANLALNYKLCNYLEGFCICSDNASYNGTKVLGNLTVLKNDIIDFVLDFDEDLFVIKSVRFQYEKSQIKGKKLLPYIGFSSFSSSKITIIK